MNRNTVTDEAIDDYCASRRIKRSRGGDSYYFTLRGRKYRVSNHSVEASNRGAYNAVEGKVREPYHPGGREKDTVYIHAARGRIIEIYENLKAGRQLDGRGKIVKRRRRAR